MFSAPIDERGCVFGATRSVRGKYALALYKSASRRTDFKPIRMALKGAFNIRQKRRPLFLTTSGNTAVDSRQGRIWSFGLGGRAKPFLVDR